MVPLDQKIPLSFPQGRRVEPTIQALQCPGIIVMGVMIREKDSPKNPLIIGCVLTQTSCLSHCYYVSSTNSM